MKKIFYGVLFVTLFFACSKKVKEEQEVYFNDFETGNLTNITTGVIEKYNGTNVLGRYNSSGFDLKLSGLPKHKLIEVSFDLLIHDSWDGNKAGVDNIDGPDIWKLIVDGNLYMNTTFSNSDCPSGTFCSPQSYPNDYPNFNNNPKTGSSNPNLPGVCNRMGQAGGTSLYRITKVIEHSKSELLLQCRDQLSQKNAPDPKCDESWSVDNLRVKAIGL